MTFEGYLPNYQEGSDVAARGTLWFCLMLSYWWHAKTGQWLRIRRAR